MTVILTPEGGMSVKDPTPKFPGGGGSSGGMTTPATPTPSAGELYGSSAQRESQIAAFRSGGQAAFQAAKQAAQGQAEIARQTEAARQAQRQTQIQQQNIVIGSQATSRRFDVKGGFEDVTSLTKNIGESSASFKERQRRLGAGIRGGQPEAVKDFGKVKFDKRIVETRDVPGVTLEPRGSGFTIPGGQLGGGTKFITQFSTDLTKPDVTRQGTTFDLPNFDTGFIFNQKIDAPSKDTGPKITVNVNDVTRQGTVSPDLPQFQTPQVFDISKDPTFTQKLRDISFTEQSKGDVSLLGIGAGLVGGFSTSIVGGVKGTKQLILQPVETIGRGLEAVTTKLPETTALIGRVIQTEGAFAVGFGLGEFAQFKGFQAGGFGAKLGASKFKSFRPRLNRAIGRTIGTRGKTVTPLSQTFAEPGRAFVFGEKGGIGIELKSIKQSKLGLEGLQKSRLRKIGLEGLERRTAKVIQPGDFLKQLNTKPTQFKITTTEIPGIRRLALERLRIQNKFIKTEGLVSQLKVESALRRTGRSFSFKSKPSKLGLETFQRGQRITKAKQNALGITDDLLSQVALEKAISKAGIRRQVVKIKTPKIKTAPAPEVLKFLDPKTKPITFDIDTSLFRNQANRLRSGADIVDVTKTGVRARPSPRPDILKSFDSIPKVQKLPQVRQLSELDNLVLQRIKKSPSKVIPISKPPKRILTAKDIFKEPKLPQGVKINRQGLVQVLERPVPRPDILKSLDNVPKPTRAAPTFQELELAKNFPGFQVPTTRFGVPDGKISPLLDTGKIKGLGAFEGRIPGGELQTTISSKVIPPTKLSLEPQFAKVSKSETRITVLNPQETRRTQTKTSQGGLQLPKIKQIGLISPKLVSKVRQAQPQAQAFRQAQPQAFKQPQLSLQLPKIKQAQRQRQPLRTRQTTKLIEEPIKIPNFIRKSKLPKQPKGSFKVLGRRFGKFSVIGKAKTERGAFQIGRQFAGTTLGATFKVQGSKRLSLPGFRTKKEAGGILFIEPRKRRLKKGGSEVLEIQQFKSPNRIF